MKIAIVGAGSMGEALASILLSRSIVEPDEILLVTRTEERHTRLSALYRGVAVSTVPDERFLPDVVVLSVKPQDFSDVHDRLAHWYALAPLVISMMTGVQVSTLCSRPASSELKVVRTMPNLPFMFGEGATGYFLSEAITPADEGIFKLLFEQTGFLLQVKDESHLDIITALSASGPGFIAPLYRALVRSAIHAGLPTDDAELLLRQTVRGFLLLLDSGLTPQEIERLVSSKGGTTEAAKEVFKKKKASEIIEQALHTAIRRARELS